MAEAARIIYDRFKPDALDINMGCPVYNLVSNFNGAALIKEPERAAAIVRQMKAAVPIPVSVKTRLGWKQDTDCLEFVKVVADAGADLVLNGHSHHYERFAPNRGITEVVVGTGGTGLNGFASTILAGSQARNATAHGVLKLTLTASGFTGEFVPVAGQSFTDTFSGSC